MLGLDSVLADESCRRVFFGCRNFPCNICIKIAGIFFTSFLVDWFAEFCGGLQFRIALVLIE